MPGLIKVSHIFGRTRTGSEAFTVIFVFWNADLRSVGASILHTDTLPWEKVSSVTLSTQHKLEPLSLRYWTRSIYFSLF